MQLLCGYVSLRNLCIFSYRIWIAAVSLARESSNCRELAQNFRVIMNRSVNPVAFPVPEISLNLHTISRSLLDRQPQRARNWRKGNKNVKAETRMKYACLLCSVKHYSGYQRKSCVGNDFQDLAISEVELNRFGFSFKSFQLNENGCVLKSLHLPKICCGVSNFAGFGTIYIILCVNSLFTRGPGGPQSTNFC